MSFKRDGDDQGLLMTLKRRRVSELLANHIPEDEAILLKNGRYSCSLCPHRPIFDTMAILAIHRKSKKHLQNLTVHLKKKEELKELISKRQQDYYIKTKASANELKKLGKELTRSSSSTLGLLKQPHYSSCSKNVKRKTNMFDRKCRIFLSDNKESNTVKEVPNEARAVKTPNSIVRSYLKGLQRKKEFGIAVEKARRNSNIAKPVNASIKYEEDLQSKHQERRPIHPSHSIEITAKDESSIDEEKQQRANYYLNLRAKGWKKDIHGNWVKDDDAEFDSDEDVPSEYPS